MSGTDDEGVRMRTSEPLESYLNDHLTGATAGVNLARKISAENDGTQLGEVLARVADEVEADRNTLERVIELLGFERSRVKEAAGWVAERVSRLRFTDQLTGTRELKLLLELESLSLGIEGKLALWQALRVCPEPRLAGVDLDELVKRAEEQRVTVERHRLEAASLAFGGPS
jgi:hypothetical protein